MSSVPAGKRSWKCPECGSEMLLSVAQLDPIACDACIVKMKGGGKSGAAPAIADAVAGPLGIWSALPETTKLGVAALMLVVGLIIGFVAGKAMTSNSSTDRRGANRSKESASTHESSSRDDEEADSDTVKRPEAPGPGYKWVRGRKRKDGTYGEDHWAKDPHYDEKKSTGK